MISKFLDSKTADTLFSHWKPVESRGSDILFPFCRFVIRCGLEPDIQDRFQVHALARIPYLNNPFLLLMNFFKVHIHLRRIGIISVFHQLEKRNSVMPDELVTQQFQKPSPGPEYTCVLFAVRHIPHHSPVFAWPLINPPNVSVSATEGLSAIASG